MVLKFCKYRAVLDNSLFINILAYLCEYKY